MNPAHRSEALNRSTRGQWELFRSHRERIERLILDNLPEPHPLLLESRPTRLCALGAGNCNDLDLGFLCDRIDEVHLVDIDALALDSAVRRQKCSDVSNLHCHAPVDLNAVVQHASSPCHGRLAHAGGMEEEQLTPSKDSPSLCASNMGGTRGTPMPRGQFEIVLSSCVLSQLIAGRRDRLGANHPDFPRERSAIITAHLKLMLELTAPGGCAIFITDIVSSDTVPQLRQVPLDDLSALMRTLIADDRTFRGLDPAAIGSSLDRLPFSATRQSSAPWLWHISALRSYLVYAVVVRENKATSAKKAAYPLPEP